MGKLKRIIASLLVILVLFLGFPFAAGNSFSYAASIKAPAKVKMLKCKSVSTNSATISWKKVSKAKGYLIYRKTPGTKWKKIATIKKASKTTYINKKLKAGGKYQYKVRAFKTYKTKGKTKYKYGKYSKTITITVRAKTANKPKNTIKPADDPENTDENTDGIKQEVFRPSDKMVIVRFTNNSGNDLDLTAWINYKTNSVEGCAGYEQKYLPNGGVFIIVNEEEESITDYKVTYKLEGASTSVKLYYEKTPYTVEYDEFGALKYVLTNNTESSGYNDSVCIFYEKNGEIIGYDKCEYGGGGESFTHTFEAPGYTYDSYIVIRTKS